MFLAFCDDHAPEPDELALLPDRREFRRGHRSRTVNMLQIQVQKDDMGLLCPEREG